MVSVLVLVNRGVVCHVKYILHDKYILHSCGCQDKESRIRREPFFGRSCFCGARQDAQPARWDAQPACRDAQPVRRDAQPARWDAQPVHQDAQPACRDAQPTALPVFLYISGTTRHDPAPHMTWGNTAKPQVRADGRKCPKCIIIRRKKRIADGLLERTRRTFATWVEERQYAVCGSERDCCCECCRP